MKDKKFVIFIPHFCNSEITYSLNVVLNQFLGLKFEINTHKFNNIRISYKESNVELIVNASFFHNADKYWLKEESMPRLPLENWDPVKDNLEVNLAEPTIPVLYGSSGIVKEKNWNLNIDIFGSIFFMLSRYEELIIEDRDLHNRFPATASIAYKANFIQRPLIDEYVEILWECMHQLWPNLKRKERSFKNFITCDLDFPFDPALYSFRRMARQSIKQILIEYNPIKSFLTCWRYGLNQLGFNVKDEYLDAIDWVMDANEKAGNAVAFYFITYATSKHDPKYNFYSRKMRELFCRIHKRGHEIGLHPGYTTDINQDDFKQSVFMLKKIFDEENIKQEFIGGRQHFLKWNASHTPMFWDKFNLDYDSTLGYADIAGFRCGTCFEFPMYDLISRSPLKLMQRPLIVMESTVISSHYMNLGTSAESLNYFLRLQELCHQFGGVYTLLWHNSELDTLAKREIYKSIIK